VRTRVSLPRRMREHATPPLLRGLATNVRAPAKSPSGAARVHLVHGSRAGEVPSLRLSLHVVETSAGTLLGKGRSLPQRRRSPGTVTLGGVWRLILGLPGDSECADSRRKVLGNAARSPFRYAPVPVRALKSRHHRVQIAAATRMRVPAKSVRAPAQSTSGAARLNTCTGVGRARRDNSQDGRRAQDSRRRAAAEASASPAMRLSLHVDAARAGALLNKEEAPWKRRHSYPRWAQAIEPGAS
jgi:hypothetical protein